MKKYIITRVIVVISISFMLLIAVSAYLQISAATDSFNNTSELYIEQMIEVLNTNDLEIKNLQEDLKEDYLIRANAAAYLITNNPSAIDSILELKKIAGLLQIDEIHIFNTSGEIYAGTVPEYYGYTFDSGEQMSFFLPMLSDYDLALAQDVTPNTAESKDMQYVAVWSEDKENIVQIGIEPISMLEAMAETDLSYIFSRFVPTPDTVLYAVELSTGKIIGTTDGTILNKTLSDIGVDLTLDIKENNGVIATEINGENGRSAYQLHGSVVVAVNQYDTSIYDLAINNVLVIILIGAIIGIAIIILFYLIIDKIVLKGFYRIKEDINKISEGNYAHRVTVDGMVEFAGISGSINRMVDNFYRTIRRFSEGFKQADLPIAMYEYRVNKVFVTEKMYEVLEFEKAESDAYLINRNVFSEQIELIMACPLEGEKDTYVFKAARGTKYVKIISNDDNDIVSGVIVDVTNEILSKSGV